MSEPGWKPHPTDAGWERYWDGTQWTGEPRRSGNSTDEPKSRSSRWVAIGAVILAVAAAGVGGLMLLREDSDSAAVMPTERTSNGGTVEGARKTLAEMFSALLSRDYEGWCSAQGSIGQAYWANKQREIASSSGATSGSDLDDCVEYGRKVAAGPEIAQFDQMRKEAATVPITMNGSEATISGWASRGGPLTMSWIADQWEVSWGASGLTTTEEPRSYPGGADSSAGPEIATEGGQVPITAENCEALGVAEAQKRGRYTPEGVRRSVRAMCAGLRPAPDANGSEATDGGSGPTP